MAPSSPGENPFYIISPYLFLWALPSARLSPTAATAQFKCGAPVSNPPLLTPLAQETTGSPSGGVRPLPGKSSSFCLLGFSPVAAQGPFGPKTSGKAYSNYCILESLREIFKNLIAQVTHHRSEFLEVEARHQCF